MNIDPFASFPFAGRRLLGKPKQGDASSRTGYGLDLQRRTGQTSCAYCGLSLVDTFEHWLLLSVDHVMPRGEAMRLRVPSSFYEDAINLLLCCSGCNGFGNRYRVPAEPRVGWQLDDFLELRDQVFAERFRLIAIRRQIEIARYLQNPWKTQLAVAPISTEAANTRRPDIHVGELLFSFRQSVAPQRDAAGTIVEYRPQDRYAKALAVPLHDHGDGSFCTFQIDAESGLVGVYLLVVNGQVRYVGECVDLRNRFNAGYGNISPRNCFVGGQSTNCKINRRILDVARSGDQVDLYFCTTSFVERKAVERCALDLLAPDWNG